MNKDIKKLIKQLIKKYHPDLTNDINTETVNNEITIKLTNILNDLKIYSKKRQEVIIDTSNKSENGLIQLENQDYLYYKLGIKYYKNIHPNFIYKRKTDNSFALKPHNELKQALTNIILSIYLSEHYFTKVILEYPNSIWRNDAIAKIKLLLKLTKSYENINPNETKVIDSASFINQMGIKPI
jgi:DnaJ-class molecular chaperone